MLSGDKLIPVENHKLVITPSFNYIVNITDYSSYKPEYEYSATWRPSAAMAAGLAGSLGIAPLSNDASILVISTSSQVPLKSEVILNNLVDEYNNYNIDQNNRIADNTIHFIDDRLLVISGELNTVENGLKSFKENNALDIQAQGAEEIGIAKTLQDKTERPRNCR